MINIVSLKYILYWFIFIVLCFVINNYLCKQVYENLKIDQTVITNICKQNSEKKKYQSQRSEEITKKNKKLQKEIKIIKNKIQKGNTPKKRILPDLSNEPLLEQKYLEDLLKKVKKLDIRNGVKNAK